MIKSIYFPDKEFSTKEELFAELRKNVKNIIACKTSEIYNSIQKGAVETSTGFLLKSDLGECKTGPQMKDGYVYPVINTTLYRDSHKDVHLNSIWDKSAKEQNGKIFYVTDHEIKTNTIIAWPGDVNVMVKSVPWSWVGKSYPGNTEALIYEISKAAIVNPAAKEIIDNKRPVQNSVRMQYVKVGLAMDSSAKEDIEFKATWDRYINDIANKEEVEADGYFFPVYEAKIVREGSMVPLGSNDATPVQQRKDGADTITPEHKNEPPKPGTQTETKFIYNSNLF